MSVVGTGGGTRCGVFELWGHYRVIHFDGPSMTYCSLNILVYVLTFLTIKLRLVANSTHQQPSLS